jgi:hypothetical protein
MEVVVPYGQQSALLHQPKLELESGAQQYRVHPMLHAAVHEFHGIVSGKRPNVWPQANTAGGQMPAQLVGAERQMGTEETKSKFASMFSPVFNLNKLCAGSWPTPCEVSGSNASRLDDHCHNLPRNNFGSQRRHSEWKREWKCRSQGSLLGHRRFRSQPPRRVDKNTLECWNGIGGEIGMKMGVFGGIGTCLAIGASPEAISTAELPSPTTTTV